MDTQLSLLGYSFVADGEDEILKIGKENFYTKKKKDLLNTTMVGGRRARMAC